MNFTNFVKISNTSIKSFVKVLHSKRMRISSRKFTLRLGQLNVIVSSALLIRFSLAVCSIVSIGIFIILAYRTTIFQYPRDNIFTVFNLDFENTADVELYGQVYKLKPLEQIEYIEPIHKNSSMIDLSDLLPGKINTGLPKLYLQVAGLNENYCWNKADITSYITNSALDLNMFFFSNIAVDKVGSIWHSLELDYLKFEYLYPSNYKTTDIRIREGKKIYIVYPVLCSMSSDKEHNYNLALSFINFDDERQRLLLRQQIQSLEQKYI